MAADTTGAGLALTTLGLLLLLPTVAQRVGRWLR